MNFALSDEHRMLRDMARNFTSKEIDLAPLLVPGATVAKARYAETWQKMAELGWAGLVIPEAFGGTGMSCIDLSMIIGETGRSLAPCPFLGTLAGTWAVLKGGSEQQKRALLPNVATGKVTLALAVCDASGASDGPGSDAKATAIAGQYVLDGSKSFVVDAAAADVIVVAAEHAGKRGLFLLDAKQVGVQIQLLPWRDLTRQVCDISFDKARAELLTADDATVWPWVRDRMLLVLSAENAAGLQYVLEMSTEYAKERVAFGRPIGAYQSIKHGLADTFGASECANAAVLYAAWALSDEVANAPLAVAMAKAYTSDAYMAATHQNIQIFGAIGFTWEMKNHLYFKRARANAMMLGAPAEHRSRVVDLVAAAA